MSRCLAHVALGACLLATLALAKVPTTKVCMHDGACVEMPVVQSGSCCGLYNITSWLGAGGRAIDTSCDYGSQVRACVMDWRLNPNVYRCFGFGLIFFIVN